MDQVKGVMDASLGKVFSAAKPPSFSVKGLGSFDNQVLFAHVDKGRDLVVEIGNVVRQVFESLQIRNCDDRPVNPHATILKMFTAPKLRRIGIKSLQAEW